jgi:hypothetical protein
MPLPELMNSDITIIHLNSIELFGETNYRFKRNNQQQQQKPVNNNKKMSSSINNNNFVSSSSAPVIVVKFVFGNETRRVSVSRDIKFGELSELIKSLFVNVNNSIIVNNNNNNIASSSAPSSSSSPPLSLKYRDNENDFITVSSDSELRESIQQSNGTSIKFVVVLAGQQQQQQRTPSTPSTRVVHAAICDSCHERIVGIRHKCEQCADYDLCERCERTNVNGSIHNEQHSFRRIESPNDHSAHHHHRRCGGRAPFWFAQHHQQLNDVVHPATCDNCHERIVGIRHKCKQCADYDLCDGCMQKSSANVGSIHTAEHIFERIDRPRWNHVRRAPIQHPTPAAATVAPATVPMMKLRAPTNDTAVSAPTTVAPSNAPATLPLMKLRSPVTAPMMKLRAPTIDTAVSAPTTVAPSNAPVTLPLMKLRAPIEAKPDQKPAQVVVPMLALRPMEATNNRKESLVKESAGSINSAFEAKLKQLEEMGFVDRQKNIEVLVKHQADLFAAVRELLNF